MKKNNSGKLMGLLLFSSAMLARIADAQVYSPSIISYQGQLLNNGAAVNGTNYLNFTLYSAATNGAVVAGPIAPVGGPLVILNSNGLFNVALNFGANSNPFTGQSLWLEMEQSLSGNANSYAPLGPRAPITATPYAITATYATALSSNAATSAATPNLIVQRDSTGSFAAKNVTLNGGLNLPFPARIYSGSNTLMIEQGSSFYGLNAGASASGTAQAGFGDNVLQNSSGFDNTAMGENALAANTFGYGNTAMGENAMAANTRGAQNTALGYGALQNGSGTNNIALGYQAGANISIGSSDIYVGSPAGSPGETSTIRIGTPGLQTSTFIAGVNGVTFSGASSPVVINANGQLGIGSGTGGGSGIWSVSGANIYYNAGSVGIGTANPQTALDVNGIATATSFTSDSDGDFVAGQISGAPSFGNIASGGSATVGGGNNNIANAYVATVSGGYFNKALFLGAFVGGGGVNTASGMADGLSTVGGGANNSVLADYGTIGGGYGNSASGTGSFIGGGGFDGSTTDNGHSGNTNSAPAGVIGGGLSNNIQSSAPDSFVGGGQGNTIFGGSDHSAIGGGWGNHIEFNVSDGAIGGGQANEINNSSDHSAIAGGSANYIDGNCSFSIIGGGSVNGIGFFSAGFTPTAATVSGGSGNQANDDYATVAGGEQNSIGGGDHEAVGGGYANSANNSYATIGGGNQNTNGGNAGTIGGGQQNTVGNYYQPTVGGGYGNTASGNYATASGGQQNTASGPLSTVPGGYQNVASGNTSFAAGAYAHAPNNNAFVWSDGTGPTVSTADHQFLIRASGGVTFYTSRSQPASLMLEIGGYDNGEGDILVFTVTNLAGTLTGTAQYSVQRSDGLSGAASQLTSLINGNSQFAALGITATSAGTQITVTANDPSSWQSLWPIAYALYHPSVETTSYNTATTISIVSFNYTTGAQLAAGSGSWSFMSDRRAKANFQTVNPQAVLDEVAAMPLATWNYRTQDKSIRHIGPMAQDFRAAFGLGENDTTISTVDEGGVALAAIQGLDQKLDEKDAEIEKLKAKAIEWDALKEQLNELNQLVQTLAAQK